MTEEYPDPDEYSKLIPRYSVRKSIDKVNALVSAPLNGWGQDPEIEALRKCKKSRTSIIRVSEV